jgi:hypothetical protein
MDGQAAKSGLNLVWGARAIANEINQTTRQTFHLLAIGAIKSARRVGGRYCADRNALRREFGAADDPRAA